MKLLDSLGGRLFLYFWCVLGTAMYLGYSIVSGWTSRAFFSLPVGVYAV